VDVLYFQICGFLKRVPEQPYAILQILLDVGLISCFVCYPHHTRMYEIRYAFRFKFLIRLELFQSFLVLFFFFVFFFDLPSITQIVNLLDDAPKIQILGLSPTGILWLKCSCGPLSISPGKSLQKKLQLLGQSRNTYRCEAFRENVQLQKHV